MKEAVVVFGALFLLLSAGPAWSQAPRVTAEKTELNFGQVFAGEKVTHAFHFSNSGDAPLTIQRVRSSCGCTAALPSARVIPPGESGEIAATFDSSRFRGGVIKTIYLHTDDPVQPVAQFTIRGKVRPEIVAAPESLRLGPLPAGATLEERIVLANEGSRDIHLLSIQTFDADLQAEPSGSVLPAGAKAEILLRVSPSKGRDQIASYIQVNTDSYSPELRIPVSVAIGPSQGP